MAEVEELPIVAIHAISWGIDRSSVQIMKKITPRSTYSTRRGRRPKPSDHG